MKIKELLREAATELKAGGIDRPWFEAQLLLAWAMGWETEKIILRDEETPSPGQVSKFYQGVAKRKGRMPSAYITGKKSFMNWDFFVHEGVLIPRPESELLVEHAAHHLAETFPEQEIVFADIGTGSGAIGLSTLLLLPLGVLHAVDCSARALEIAGINAASLGVGKRVTFYQGDLLAPLHHLRGQLMGIVANLPYIPREEYRLLQAEILNYEPRGALVSGEDGLDHYRRFFAQLEGYLRPDGLLFVEIGWNQSEAMVELFRRHGFTSPALIKDLAGLPRVVWGRK